MYDDRIEIVFSGGLPIGLSEDEFFAGRSIQMLKDRGILKRVGSKKDGCWNVLK